MKRFLLIDTANQPARVAIATAQEILAETEIGDRRQLSEQLLAQIDRLSRQAKEPLADLSAIGIVTGPGSFTALRIGAAVTNALAYAHTLPIVSAKATEVTSTAAFAALTGDRLADGRTTDAILPDYGKEPTITPPKPGRKRVTASGRGRRTR